jgi:putative ABC transport system permease protein
MFESLKSDLRSAYSTLRHRPGVAAAVVVTLSLGIAANTAVFSVVDAVLLRPLPYPEPERIVTLWNRYGATRTASSPPDYMDRRRESRLLEFSAAWTSRPANLAVEGEARRAETTRVTSDFFRVMGVDPMNGPAALPEETSGSGERLAILSFGLWQGACGGEDMLGRTIRLDGESYLVTGVMPRGFDYPEGTEIFLPLVFTPEQLADGFRGNEYLFEVARMRPDVALPELAREIEAVAASVLERVPERREFLERNGFGAEAVALRDHLVGGSKAALSMLAAAVLVVLLVTAANVAHILLASGSARFHELVLRSSLGATRRRLFSQLVVESVLLSMAGGVLGLALSYLVVGAAPNLAAAELPGASRIALDGRGVLFTLLVALGMGILCGLAPARMASGAALRSSTRSSASGGARRLRNALVVSQVALALVLMIGAGLLVRSYERISSRDPGFRTDGRVGFGLDFPRALYPEPEGRAALARELLERLRTIPGARSVGASARIPLGGNPWTGTFHPEGFDLAPGVPVPGAEFNVVSPDFLKSLGIPLLRGRDFSSADDAGSAPVVLVDRWTEERFWPEGAVGRRIDVGGDLYEVVGVVGHVLYESLDERGRFQLYFPALQRYWWRHLDFTLEAESDAAVLIPYARAEVARLAPDVAVHSIRTLDTLVVDSLAFRELQTTLVGAFGLVVLTLAALGIYGVLSYTVSQRRMEVGLRMALGATRKTIVGLVLKEGMILFGFGIALGWMGALAASTLFSGLLYGIEPTDATSYVAVTAGLSVVALASALVPALRASRTDPWSSLRSD